jgi:hypothetical protein
MAKYNIEYEIEEGEYISLTHEKMERLLDTIKSFIDVPSLSRFVKPFNPYFTSSYYAKLFSNYLDMPISVTDFKEAMKQLKIPNGVSVGFSTSNPCYPIPSPCVKSILNALKEKDTK